MNELALFAGAGGGILGGKLLGWKTVCAVECDAYARDVLVARQNDQCLAPFPIWDDVRTFDGEPWRGSVDVVSGGFPCQDISAAGKGAGINGERSGLWKEMARIVGEILPQIVFVENSPMLVGRGLGMVLGDLAEMGYDTEWGVVGAHHAGAPHKRERIWLIGKLSQTLRNELEPRSGRWGVWEGHQAMADTDATRLERHRNEARESEVSEPWNDGESMGDADEGGRARGAGTIRQAEGRRQFKYAGWWAAEPDVGRVAHGVAARVDRLRCLGNGQVPRVVPLAWAFL